MIALILGNQNFSRIGVITIRKAWYTLHPNQFVKRRNELTFCENNLVKTVQPLIMIQLNLKVIRSLSNLFFPVPSQLRIFVHS